MTGKPIIDLIPYCNLPGKGWTFTDDQIIDFYAQMVKDGTLGTVFSDGLIRSALDFLDHMKDPRGQLFMVVADIPESMPVAIIWLNDFQARWCQIHFCVFSHAWGRDPKEIGSQILSYIMTMKTNDGSRYLHDMIIGIVPEWNRLAVAYAGKSGMKVLCILPYGCFNIKKNRSEPGILFCATREILGVEE